MNLLNDFLNCQVLLVTQDGRSMIGTLKGTDQQSNILLFDTTELHSATSLSSSIGNQLIRSDSMYFNSLN